MKKALGLTCYEHERQFTISRHQASVSDDWGQQPRKLPLWGRHKEAIKRKFPEGFNPPKKLSREAMDVIRRLHAANPSPKYTGELSNQFKVSYESIQRIVKSKWVPPAEKIRKETAKGRVAEDTHQVLRRIAQQNEANEIQMVLDQWRQGKPL